MISTVINLLEKKHVGGNKNIFVIRHCEAEGQPKQAPLTNNGQKQANTLGSFLADYNIDRIISSPFVRAIESAKPLSNQTNIDIEIDKRLSERILSPKNLPDWLEKLERTFVDLDLTFNGGESSRKAMERIVNVVDDIRNIPLKTTAIFTHGNIMSLLIKHFDNTFGFTEWKKLTNPDVFLLTFHNDTVNIKRIWKP